MYDHVAAKLFPTEWEEAVGTADGTGRQRKKKLLRGRAEQLMRDASRFTNDEPPAFANATPKPVSVRIAGTDDATGLLELVRESDKELAITTRDYGKISEIISLSMDPDLSSLERPIFGVVGASGSVEAACGLFPTEPWDSFEMYLRGFFLFVSHASRRSTHAQCLFQFANWFGDRVMMPVVWEVLNTRTLDERSRLFSRHAAPFGGIFIHRPVAQAAA
jgi:hypothetical protein